MKNAKLPLWLNALTAVLFLSNLLVFGLLTLLFPTLTWPDAGETAVFPIQFLAVRHIALALPLLHGLLKQDRKILTTLFTIFFVIAVFDVGLVLVAGYYIPLVVRLTGEMTRLASFGLAALLFIIPMGLTLRYLRSYGNEKTASHAIKAEEAAGFQG